MESLDNISLQSDEMEALVSIFGDKLQMLGTSETFSIDITKNIKLFLTMVPEYPSLSLPNYELLAPELSSDEKRFIDKEFKKLFENEEGGPLIYQMIMTIEELANNRNATDSKLDNLNDDIVLERDVEIQSTYPVKAINNLEIIHGSIIVDRKSVFQGHVCKVNDKQDVSTFMDLLLENRKIAQATHNISAYRITLPNNVVLQDCNDDGEHRASSRLLDLLQTLKLSNVMVVVSRWYGGIQLGPDRFRHISNAARQALVEAGLVK